MNNDEANYLQRYMTLTDQELENEKLRRLQAENNLGQMSAFTPDKDQNLVEYQLDLKEELDRIHHLLSGHILTINNDGNEVWEEPTDDRLKIFSEYGVKQIMNIISFYVNRDTLLSNYKDEMIIWKVRDFGIELSDLIYNKYELFFHYPTPEELFEVYKPIAEEKGMNLSDAELYKKCVQWSNEELQGKLRFYPMIITALIDLVHSTYLRALNGEERESLRKQTHISQSANPLAQMQMPQKTSLLKPSTWGRA